MQKKTFLLLIRSIEHREWRRLTEVLCYYVLTRKLVSKGIIEQTEKKTKYFYWMQKIYMQLTISSIFIIIAARLCALITYICYIR